ncbi:MAG: glycosyltransferase family 39 protein [Candidatus Obscuribacter sp.]|nr:glycosyltransferase family 39 protein [Candidatus Melainabacteria bacterium]MDX1989020.1 glycosyltransferase family 39 protein [Candidatus Obscuribacter sp.]
MSSDKVIKDGALIFLLALALRLTYLFAIEHLVVQEGDAFYFLSGGSELLKFTEAVLTGKLNSFEALLAALGQVGATDAQVMSSAKLADRFMNDGPVITTYMAVVNLLAGVPPGSKDFNAHIWNLGIIISIVSSLSCVCTYLLARRFYGRFAAILAALFLAFYPPACLNVQSCYSEIFCSALLPLWLYFIDRLQERRSRAPLDGYVIFLGFLTAALMLSKPLFYLLPPAVALAYLLTGRNGFRSGLKTMSKKALPFGLGLAMIFAPWLFITRAIAGKPLLTVTRSPAFNLFLGSDLARDGWRAYPFQQDIPTVPADAINRLLRSFKQEPLAVASMEVRKVPRLLAGSWNEFRYKVFGLDTAQQDFLHRLLLLLGLSGLMLTLSARDKTQGRFALLSALVLLSHLSYCAFEPISRYNYTAIPILTILAGHCLARLGATTALPALLSLSGLLVLVLSNYRNLASSIASPSVLGNGALELITASVCALSVLAFAGFLCRTGAGTGRPFKATLAALTVFGSAAVCTFFCILNDRELYTCSHSLLKPVQTSLSLADLPTGDKVALLLDLESPVSPLNLIFDVNGKEVQTKALPYMTVKRDQQFFDILNLQLKGMGGDANRLRQWWLVQLPRALFQSGENQLSIKAQAPALIYGSGRYKPSVELLSWTKGFTTSERDLRPYIDGGKPGINLSYLNLKSSRLPGLDQGRLIFEKSLPEREIAGHNPLASNLLARTTFKPEPSTLFVFTCKARSRQKQGDFYAQVIFSGKDANREITWISPMTPMALPLARSFREYAFADFLPPELTALKSVDVEVKVLPYQQELPFLQRKRALSRSLLMRQASLSLVALP